MHPAKLPSNSQQMQQLGESEEAPEDTTADDIAGTTRSWNVLTNDKEDTGGWLETDDIHDF